MNAPLYFGTPVLDWCFWRVGEGLWFACKSTGDSTGGRAHNPTPLSVVDRGDWREVRTRVWR